METICFQCGSLHALPNPNSIRISCRSQEINVQMSQNLAELNYLQHWQSGWQIQGNDWLKMDQKQGKDYNVKVPLLDY